MKTKVIKWMNLFLVLAVLFGYQWIALGNQKKRDDYKQLKMENEKKLPTKWKMVFITEKQKVLEDRLSLKL